MGVAEICVGGGTPQTDPHKERKGPLYGEKMRISVP